MADLKPFPTTRTIIGTLMGVGVTPEARQNQRLVGFAIFESNGRLENYIVQSLEDFKYLQAILQERAEAAASAEQSMRRDDLQVESNVFPTPVLNIQLYRRRSSGEWIYIPASAHNPTPTASYVVEPDSVMSDGNPADHGSSTD